MQPPSLVIVKDNQDLYHEYANLGPAKIDKDDDKKTYKTQFEDITELHNQFDDVVNLFKTADNQNPDSREGSQGGGQFSGIALIYRRTYRRDPEDRNGPPVTVTLELHSPVLRQSFTDIVKDCTAASLVQNPIVLVAPFAELHFCQEDIRKAIQEAESDEVRSNLQLLEDFREKYMKKTTAELEATLKEGRITAANIWSLFPIGSHVILENRNALQTPMLWCVVVRGCHRSQNQGAASEAIWNILIEHMTFDGSQLVAVEKSFKLGGFKGMKRIRNLPAYPLDLHPQKEQLRLSLIERGRSYLDLAQGKGSHRNYAGPMWNLDDFPSATCFHDPPTRLHDSRIVVDPAGLLQEDGKFTHHIMVERFAPPNPYENYPSNRRVGAINQDNTDPDDIAVHQAPNDNDLLTLPATIPAYLLSLKVWGLVDLAYIKPVTWQDDIYDMLQMEAERKAMVRHIIANHHASSSTFDDFVPGKGRGIVFLLHGPPGCGKTLTAESAAESLHRPLYYMSGAELGMLQIFGPPMPGSGPPMTVEGRLELIFKRIARWDAILLLDEAESFVASRQSESHNAQKNALTSILLRTLEYQSGIVFLTTNRISDFDSALFSRVHFSLKFDQLTPSHCRFIWTKLASQTEHNLTESDFDKLSQLSLDGRTIKNVLRVASLQAKIRSNLNSATSGKMSMIDVSTVLPYAVGVTENSRISQQLEALQLDKKYPKDLSSV